VGWTASELAQNFNATNWFRFGAARSRKNEGSTGGSPFVADFSKPKRMPNVLDLLVAGGKNRRISVFAGRRAKGSNILQTSGP